MAAQVLSPPPAPTTTTPSPQPSPSHRSESPDPLSLSASSTSAAPRPRDPRPQQQRERIPSYAQNRMSHYSHRSSRSRPQSTAFPVFASSLAYATVRDFAYPVFHPMHYGAPPDPPSGASTPGSEWNNGGGRRLSDPLDGANSSSGHGSWSAGPWGGDGAIYGDPEDSEGGGGGVQPLPSTSFADEGGRASADESGGASRSGSGSSRSRTRKHRKSKSYANFSDYERGRRRESAGNNGGKFRRSRASGDMSGASSSSASASSSAAAGAAGAAGDMFHFSGQQHDPAGRDTLRQSRIGQPSSTSTTTTTTAGGETGAGRRDSHFQTMLPNRSFGTSSASRPQRPVNSDLPLDAETPSSPHTSYSPQRQSIGPEDEELYAGQSLALYAFEPENANELRLREGQVILVSYRHGQGWLVAEDPESGEQGLVPEEYVRLLSDLPHYDLVTGQFREVEGEGEEGEDEGEGEGEGEGDDDDEDGGGEGEGEEQEEGMEDRVQEGGGGGDLAKSMEDLRVDEAYEQAEAPPVETEVKH